MSARPHQRLGASPSNLPLQLTSFIGRDAEMADLKKLITENRIITLTGAGGSGKTRLGLQLVADVADKYPDGVWWVDLAPITDEEVVASKVATTLSVREVESQSIVDTLVDQMRERRLVLLLDNCEHVIVECAELVSAVSKKCPQVWVLATSQEPLGVTGETTYRVPSLSFPQTDPNSVDDLASYDSVQLFVDRARKVRPNFEPTEETARAIGRICRRLDGIPLALELAAARVRVLSPSQIADALSERFDLLTGGARTALPRQRTLEASVDWSYTLLGDDERTLLARLSVFAGGFRLQAAEEVTSGGAIERHRVLDLLSGLTDKSLVQVEDSGREARYRLLETVRAYARQKLADSDEISSVSSRHLDYYVALAERAGPELRGRKFSEWATRLTEDMDNLHAAEEWALLSHQEEKYLRLAGALLPFWIVRSLYSEVRRSMETALLAEVEPNVRVKALGTAALVSVMASKNESAAAVAQECVTLAREVGDKDALGWGLLHLGWAQHWLGRGGLDNVKEAANLAEVIGDRGLAVNASLYRGVLEGNMHGPATGRFFLDEAVAAARESGDDYALSVATYFAGATRGLAGRFVEARLLFEESLELSRTIDNRSFLSFALGEFGWVLAQQGHYARARRLIDEAVDLGRQAGATAESNARMFLALLGWAEGDLNVAEEQLVEILRLQQEKEGNVWFVVLANHLLGAIALVRGDHERARPRLEEALDLARSASLPWLSGRALDHLGRMARAEGDLPKAESLTYEGLDVLYRYGDLAGTTDVLESIAGLAGELESFEEAVRLFGASARLRQEIGYVRFPVYRSRYEDDVAAAATALGEEHFDRAWAEGLALSVEEAVAYSGRGRGERKRPSVGWPSLTPTELEVVQLVAEGLSNPEIATRLFIARNTVKVHLSHIFTKLGVASRAELAAEATRRDM